MHPVSSRPFGGPASISTPADRPLWPRIVLKLAFLALAAAFLFGCSRSEPAADSGPTTLRVGDQIETLQRLLRASGQDKPSDYKIEWSNFLGGPAVIAAQTGGSVDVGWMAETPLVFAQAAGSPVKVIAV